MRVVLLSERISVDLKNVLRVVLIEAVQLVLIASGQGVGNLLGRLVGQSEAQRLIFEAFPPALVKLFCIGCPGHGGVIDDEVLVQLVIKALQGLL